MAFPKFTKDPQAVLDYEIDWSAWLEEDTISASEWTVPDGLTLESDSFADTTTMAWLSGGTAGTNYDVTCEIVTDGGRTDDRTITIQVKQK